MNIGIIGGGCSGVLCALALPPETQITIFEPAECLGIGVAYGTDDPQHLLNVPASRMSAISDQPDHFSEWLEERHPGNPRDAFVPRMWYGEYLSETLRKDRRATHIRQNAVEAKISQGGAVTIITADARSYTFDCVILALGIPKSEWPVDVPEAPLAFPDPWAVGVVEKLLTTDSVTFLGAGLTTIDILLSLASRGYQGSIAVLSRHGLLPNAHFAEAIPDIVFDGSDRTLQGIYRWMKRRSNEVRWDKVIDALRPHTQNLWQGFSEKEKSFFLRHLKSFWEVHRHRMAPKIGEKIESLKVQGRFDMHAGRFLEWNSEAGIVSFRPRGESSIRHLKAEAFVNCTGFARITPEHSAPIIQSLRKDGALDLDSSGLGLASASAILRDPLSRIKMIGAYRRAELFETTAVPTLAPQALEIAKNIGRLGD